MIFILIPLIVLATILLIYKLKELIKDQQTYVKLLKKRVVTSQNGKPRL